MSFFKQFPQIQYDFKRDGILQNMVDIYRSVRPLPSFLDNISAYKFYNVVNGERPDIVSGRIYGTSQFYWTFFVVNEHLHDGYRSWPLSQESLLSYINKQYDGFVIETAPSVLNDPTHGAFANSLAGRFQVGETITGSTSGASGTLTKKITDLSQLVVQNVTGTFEAPELISGSTSADGVSSHAVYKYIDAPYYYYDQADVDKKPITNALHINGGVYTSNTNYVSNREHIEEKNDEYAQIRYIDPNYINQFVREFNNLLNI
tara:strand:- start:1704 stop:2486 length:783 start_codon:yes stop_codon:yes gene_type:complete